MCDTIASLQQLWNWACPGGRLVRKGPKQNHDNDHDEHRKVTEQTVYGFRSSLLYRPALC